MLDKTKINLLIVHCSDTPDDKDLRALDIHEMHLSFGWDGIGYHKVICRNGNIENGRPEFWIGAHTFNKNDRSLGVCLIGRNNFSDLQFLSLKNLLIEWKIKYPNSIILGHRDSINTNKTCPNFNVNEWCKKENLL
jgi:N-acetylmuramoyl-L-alanine amidase